jgi:hypothetical protein
MKLTARTSIEMLLLSAAPLFCAAAPLDIGNRQLVIETPQSLEARIAAAHEVPIQFNTAGERCSLSPR